MLEKLVLKNPIMITGKSISELSYDFDEITVELFGEAENKKFIANGAQPTSGVFETDYTMHLYLGMAAIIAVNPQIDFEELKSLKGQDVKAVMTIGRNFMIRGADEDLKENNSDELYEDTPDTSTPQ